MIGILIALYLNDLKDQEVFVKFSTIQMLVIHQKLKLMNTKKLIICTVAIFVMYVVMDLVWYDFFFPEQYKPKASSLREEPYIAWALLGLLIASFLFSYLFVKLAKGSKKIQEGVKHGFILGAFMYLPLFFIFYATRDIQPMAGWLINATFHISQFMLFGIVVAHISGLPDPVISDVNN